MKNIFLAVIAALALAGCGPQEPVSASKTERHEDGVSDKEPSVGRYELRLMQNFRDRGAYNGWRSVYELTDKDTGRVYIGVSGIGISETGSHSAGKTTVRDER